MTNEMANEEAKKRLEIWLKCHNCPEDKQCYDKHLNTVCEDYVFVVNNPLEDSIKAAIKALSAPDREKGEWIYCGNSDVNGLKICECTNCHKRNYGSHKFCPNCGADMRGKDK